ncbi:MAG: 2-amino-4-hydroxy-6-hydroxymethyldihydropteridine diphosphokinase [Hyphomicrobiales bacterium]|nr:2-amino-4-hydroxy-6-hydroxymethyldihydropteridine diphosphokinase [Hyphomicrobiales bacterium]NBR11993.1 2-amino-4-hydroxy-6-hydroxymethyldihydropteridine diphosphokinase [Alphaproteobacteria bacterium]
MADALISLGSNIGDPLAALQKAIDHLSEDPAISIKKRSSFYRTTPVGPVAQDDFINAAVLISTSLQPDALMQILLDIETKMGRDRTHAVRFGPRVIDLDLILYDDVKQKSDLVELPHPRFRERAFVLVPLAELAPLWRVDDLTLLELAAQVGDQGVKRL